MMIVFPVFGRLGVTGLVRNSIALVISIPLIPMIAANLGSEQLGLGLIAALLLKEVIVGLVVGVVLAVPLYAAEVAGDVLDAKAVTATVPGHDAVISALGHSRPSPAGHDLHPGVSHIIDAMKTARVSRLIWISSHGVGDSRGHSGFLFERIFAPLRLRAEFADKERQEALVTASDLDWTIIRPARLTNGPLTRRPRAQPRLRISIRDSISRADVADFVLTELEHGDHLLAAPTIATT